MSISLSNTHMKSFSEIQKTLFEYVNVPQKDAPKFVELPTNKMTPSSAYSSYRFNIHKHENGDTGLFAIHDKETGKHVGTIHYNRIHKNGHVLTDIAKSPDSKHSKMMSEVIAHLHDACGHKMFSSTTLSAAGLAVWKHLAATHNVAAVDDSTGKMKAIAHGLAPNQLVNHLERKSPDKSSKQFWLGDSK